MGETASEKAGWRQNRVVSESIARFYTAHEEELAKFSATEAEYFARNADRMRYPEFRADHLFIGSGVIEAGCKTVIGLRLKQSGMFWTVPPLQPAQSQI